MALSRVVSEIFRSNHRPISHCFRDKRRFPSKIANFPTPVYLTPHAEGVLLGAMGSKSCNDRATRRSKKF